MRNSPRQCFYCGANVTANAEDDHFPLPRAVGGQETVSCCVSCHDMKDRYPLDVWPAEWMLRVMADFPKLSRETKIFLAKALRLFAETAHKQRQVSEGRPLTAEVGTGASSPIGYEQKFAQFINLCATTEKDELVVVATPTGLGDTYAELVESLNRLADAELRLAIVPRKDRRKTRNAN